MEREQIIKALECCASDECELCPYSRMPTLANCVLFTMGNALALIKELTEENEKLTINMNAYGLTAKRLGEENEKLRADNKRLVNDNAELKNQIQEEIAEEDINLFDEFTKQLHEGIRGAKADTVREMQERFEKEKYEDESGWVVPIDELRLIAKEMLEGQ